ncbi:MAG: hypothetical protein ABEJ57_00380 [Halobacteriaceae archaeon]
MTVHNTKATRGPVPGMDLRRTAVALTTGAVTFLLVAVAVTAALEPRIEFSVFLGLPAGFIAGVLVTAGVALTLSDPENGLYAVGVGTGAAGITVLLVAVVGAALRYPLSTTLLTAALVGAIAGVASALLVSYTDWATPA